MVKIERTPTPPPSLAREEQKAHGSYCEPDVIEQLTKDFHNKCYLCGLSEPSDIQVEHLRPHHNRAKKERVFDWNNLFLSCPHCNSMKNAKCYDDAILDCCRIDPEPLLNHIFAEGYVSVTANQPEAEKTAELITACFERRNTGIREYGCHHRYKELAEEMNTLFRVLERYQKQPDSRRCQRSLRGQLGRETAFAAFKRYYVRVNYPELCDLLES